MNEKREIKYLNRDFQTTLKRLIEYVKYYFPDSFNDFSPASPAMVFLQLISYVSDVLNFYIDKQTKESLLTFATQKKWIYELAQSYGYKIKIATPSIVQLYVQCVVPKSQAGDFPNFEYAPIILPGMTVYSSKISQSTFTVIQSINFKTLSQNDEILPVKINENNWYIIRKKVTAYAMIEKQQKFVCGSRISENIKLYLQDNNVLQIISVTDTAIPPNNWYEVPNLSIDNVIDDNIKFQGGVQVYKRKKTNKRFRVLVTQNNKTYLYFGSRNKSNRNESEFYDIFYSQFQNDVLNPSLFVLNNNYGEIPYDTTLNVKYWIANSITAPALSIDTIGNVEFYNQDINTPEQELIYEAVKSSLIVTNPTPATGGSGPESLQSIKYNTQALISSQNRVVTLQDYTNALKVFPQQYGNIAKSAVSKNTTTNLIQLWVLSYNEKKQLVQTLQQTKKNIGQYLEKYRVLGDFIKIKDAYIINIGCEFTITCLPGFEKRKLLYLAIEKIKQFFNIDNFQIGTPININDLRNEILKINGISNVLNISLINKYDGLYSPVRYKIEQAYSKQGIYYPSQIPSIFQLKYPEFDIVGNVL